MTNARLGLGVLAALVALAMPVQVGAHRQSSMHWSSADGRGASRSRPGRDPRMAETFTVINSGSLTHARAYVSPMELRGLARPDQLRRRRRDPYQQRARTADGCEQQRAAGQRAVEAFFRTP